jgi:hypothetical protein
MAFNATAITTAQWAAKPPHNAPFELTIPRYVIIHHTDSQNPPRDPSRRTKDRAMVYARSIQNDHFRRGWSDSGHNFLNTTGGFVLEGRTGTVDAIRRGNCVRSAHAAQDPGKLPKGNESPGIENEGNFMTFPMGDTQWASLVALCAELCRALSIHPSNIRGHREFSNTDCPGDWLFGQLPRLRQEAAAKIGIEISPAEAFGTGTVHELAIGDFGPQVMTLQMRLLGSGFSPGAIDGIFGENTRAAVIAFQRNHNLKATGRIDSSTRRALGL